MSEANVGGSRKTGYDEDNRNEIVYKNTRMFFNLSATLNSKRKMIFLGSGAEYDLRYYQPKMKEEYFGVHIPEDAYGFSKYICSKYIEKTDNIVNLRLFGVFGKNEDYEYKFISNTIVKNLFGLPCVICQNIRFDYLYILDLMRVLEYFIDNEVKYSIYNVTPNESIDLLTIAEKVNHISGNQFGIIVKNSGMNTEYSGDNSRLVNEIGNIFTSYDNSIKELYAWYKFNLDKIDRKVIETDEYMKHCRIKK